MQKLLNFLTLYFRGGGFPLLFGYYEQKYSSKSIHTLSTRHIHVNKGTVCFQGCWAGEGPVSHVQNQQTLSVKNSSKIPKMSSKSPSSSSIQVFVNFQRFLSGFVMWGAIWHTSVAVDFLLGGSRFPQPCVGWKALQRPYLD